MLADPVLADPVVTDVAATAFADEQAFVAADPRRAVAREVELGATWHRPGSDQAHRLVWLDTTGELVLARLEGYDCRDLTVLALVPTERDLDVLLEGWRHHRDGDDGLGWLAARVTPAPRSAA